MNILIPTADYPPIEGGISSLTVHVARELAGLGHEVTVIAPYFPGMDAFDAAEPAVVARYKGYRLGRLRFFPMLAASWRRMAACDVVLGMNVASGGLLGYLGFKRYRKPYVTFAYAYEFLKCRNNPLAAALLRPIYGRARVVVAISGFTRDSLVRFGVPTSRIEVIFPGAAPAKPSSGEARAAIRHKFVLDSCRVILAVGRFIAGKGHRTLVRAMPQILERFPDAVLVLAGRGPDLYDVIQEAMTVGVREHVVFPGCVSDEDLAGLYQACEVFALPTGEGPRGQVEGFGLVFAEANAYGKPVVAGRSGGVADAVIDGETGFLVDPDDPEAVAAAIVSILADPALARRLGENGRRRVESDLNWKRFVQRLLEVVEARR